MSNQCLEEILAGELGQICAQSWINDEIRKKGVYGKRGFNAELAKATGLSLSYIGKVLAAKARVTPNFLITFGVYLGLTEQEVLSSIETKLSNFTETTKDLFADGRLSEKFSRFATVIPSSGLKPINIKWATKSPLNEIFPPPVSEKQLKAGISRYFEYCSEECSDDLNLGEIMSDILFHLPHLPRHEVLELLHQVWKLRYNRSDSLAVQVADEDFKRYGIKPKTRIKLERIPVEGAEGEEGK